MFVYKTKIRVRYDETDAMGFVYHGKYAVYYEQARTDLLRHFGLSYRKMEEDGWIMPVIHLESNYLKPAQYDDELTIHCIIRQLPKVKLCFDFEIYKEDQTKIHTGSVHLVTLDAKTRRPVACPNEIIEVLTPYFT